MVTVAVVNQSTSLTDTEAWQISWALNYQALYQFGPAWGIQAAVHFVPAPALIPSGAWALHLLDTSDQEGALGYHDEDGNQVPYGRVFVKTARANGQRPSEVASHELLELLVDPHVNLTAYDPKSSRLYACEVGDPCQSSGYDVGAPEKRLTGVTVANFILPGWLDPNTAATAPTDYRGTLRGPFALGHGGYVSFTKQLPPTWEQQMGDHANPKLGGNDERVLRRALPGARPPATQAGR